MAENEYLTVPHEKPYKYEEGNLTVTRGSAWTGPGCHLGCGVLLYTDEDGKLVKVEGDPENPYNEGRLCVRCLALPEVTNHKDRLLYPMKRDPKDRGKNKWERMSWDEAIDYVADRFIEIRDKYGAETIIFGQGTGRDIASWITRLAWSYGSPNYTCFALSGLACYLPRVAGMAATSGGYTVADCSQQFPDRYDNPNWRCPELMVLWGNYPLRANSDGFYGHWMIDLMKRGMKIMMVDPRVTWLSLKAEEHLRLRPGTDAALALGMMNVIINEDLYDHDFVEKWCYGFDELTGRVQEYPPAKVAEITWVPEDQIVRAARLLATSKPAAMQWGLAVDMVKEALPAGQAIVGLFQITGNVDVPGGNIFPVELIAYSGGWGGELHQRGAEGKAHRPRRVPAAFSGLPGGADRRAFEDHAHRQTLQDARHLAADQQRHRLHGRRAEKGPGGASAAGVQRRRRPVHDPDGHGVRRRGAARLHLSRKGRPASGRRPAARRGHQQGHPGRRGQVRRGDQPPAGQAAQPRGLAVGQHRGHAFLDDRHHGHDVPRTARPGPALPPVRVQALREGPSARRRQARLQYRDRPHRAVVHVLQPVRPRPDAVLRRAEPRPGSDAGAAWTSIPTC